MCIFSCACACVHVYVHVYVYVCVYVYMYVYVYVLRVYVYIRADVCTRRLCEDLFQPRTPWWRPTARVRSGPLPAERRQYACATICVNQAH